MQIEKTPIATAEKIRLVDMLSDCVFPEIEVTSFVSPKWVPQMADAEDVVAGFKRRPGTKYTCVYLNSQGMARAVGTQKLDVEGSLSRDGQRDVLEEEHQPRHRGDVRRGGAAHRGAAADEACRSPR